jgi:hypothetical protein
MTAQPPFIPWATFLEMTPPEIDALFGDEADRTAIEITTDVRQLLTESTEEAREDKAS